LLLVNRFCILNIEESKTSIYKPIVILLPSFSTVRPVVQKLKWKKKLPKQLSISIFNICRALLVLTVKLCTTDTSKVHSIKAFLDYGATRRFINRDFVCNKRINTQSISYPISMFNVNGTLNKTKQISEVVDVVLQYNIHSEWILLVISSLNKQDLILGYP